MGKPYRSDEQALPPIEKSCVSFLLTQPFSYPLSDNSSFFNQNDLIRQTLQ